jgi:heme exporter protein D
MRSKAMGLGAMFVLLVVVILLLPLAIRWLTSMEPHYVISGFQDLNAAAAVEDTRNQVLSTPQMGATGQLPVWRPDPNTDYVCRSPGGGDQPCPEGTFCDGPSQSCVANYLGGATPSDGYYA